MQNVLGLIPLFPLLGFLVLIVGAQRLPSKGISWLGVLPAVLSWGLTVLAGLSLVRSPSSFMTQPLWSWWDVGGWRLEIALRLDSLSLLMAFVVTLVGTLILAYSLEYMKGDPSRARFFGVMNLFIGSMLILVLADNLPLLYLGWEGVGFCSYLLIGFWYENPVNVQAAKKAFVVTRVGDAALAVGLLLLFGQLGTLQLADLMEKAAQQWPVGSPLAVAAAALLLVGALGKSAQLPLQVWLPDAMAGPTPVSALLHSATMVTAGFYLIARTHPLFLLAPSVMGVLAVIGAVTLLVAALSALARRDIKRILAGHVSLFHTCFF